MPSATVESPVAKPRNVKRFIARRTDLVLTKIGREPVYGPGGVKVNDMPGEKIAFRGGILEVPLDEGATIKLVDGRDMPAQEILDWLTGVEGDTARPAHRLYGDREDGFWDLELPAPAPSSEELDRLQDLAIYHDVDGLEAFIAAERAGFNRPELIEVAEGTIERVRKVQEQMAERSQRDAATIASSLGVSEADVAAAQQLADELNGEAPAGD